MIKKIMYIALLHYDHTSDGVVKKIQSQINIFERKGYSVDLYTFFENHSVMIRNGKVVEKYKESSRKNLFKEILHKKQNYDFLYVRHCGCDFYYFKLLRKYSNSLIVDEIPTYPYKVEYLERDFGHIKYMVDYIFWHLCKKYIYRVITYSNHSTIFNIPTIKTMNGYDFSKTYLKNIDDKRCYLHLVFVANFSESHGLDRLITGLDNYYKSNSVNTIVKLRVIGFSDIYEKYKKYVESSFNLKKYIFFEGEKNGNDLFEILANSDIGVCSLAGFRQNIYLSSELKSREYGAFGLPMIGDIVIDYLGEDSPYYLKIDSKNEAVDINKIITFYNKLNKIPNFNYKLRELALKECDMNKSLDKVIQIFEEGEK